MRLGGHVFDTIKDPSDWIRAHVAMGYTAAYCPPVELEDTAGITAYRKAAVEADLMIAEVGAWSNPISPDDSQRREAIRLCIRRLALAEEIGALCCVNIAGSRSEIWCGPHPDNLTSETFALIVDTTREIIDAVKPRRTRYALETMPWIYPYSADSYVDLIRAIDRDAFGVHLDPVNLVNSPLICYKTTELIEDCFRKLGPYILSCHAKDIVLKPDLMVHLEETRPGLGTLDYRAFLREIRRLDRDVPLMMEHLSTEEEYRLAAEYIRGLI